MSRPLRIAFCGEGNTDSRVLPVVIEKILNSMTLVEAFNLAIDTQRWDTRRRFEDAFITVVEQSQVFYQLVIVHVDADSPDDRQVRERKVRPAMDALTRVHLDDAAIVWAIPVQAIEAWLLVSPEAFVRALTGSEQRAHELHLPLHPEQIHRDRAKQLFDESVYQLLARTQCQRRRLNPGHFQESVATEVELGALRMLPAFRQFEHNLTQALVALGYIVEGLG